MDTINRYLDQDLAPAELEELGRALLADRDLAASFARSARLDQTLEESFTEVTNEAEFGELAALLTPPQIHRRPIRHIARTCAAAAAVVAIGFGIIQLWPSKHERADRAEVASEPVKKRIQRPRIQLPQTRLTATLPPQSRSDAEAEALLRQRLSRFFLPDTAISSLPLDEALASIQESLHTVDPQSWTAHEPVEFELVERPSSSEPPPVVNLNRRGISVLNALNLLAMQSGYELAFSPSKIEFVAKEATETDEDHLAEPLIRNYEIPISTLQSGPYQDPLSTSFSPDGLLLATASDTGVVRIWDATDGELVDPVDPSPNSEITSAIFTPDGKLLQNPDGSGAIILATDPEWAPIQEALQGMWDVAIAQGDRGSYSPDSGQLALSATVADHARFSALLSEATGTSASSPPITITTKLISLPPELAGTTDLVVNAEEWQHIIRDWSQQPGVDIMTAPKITARIGTEASAQILTTRFIEVNQEPGDDFGKVTVSEATGLSLPFTTSATGEQITIRGSIEQSLSEEMIAPEILEQLGGSDPESPIVHFNTEVEAPLFPGQVALFECESHEPGSILIAAVGVSWIAPPFPPDSGH